MLERTGSIRELDQMSSVNIRVFKTGNISEEEYNKYYKTHELGSRFPVQKEVYEKLGLIDLEKAYFPNKILTKEQNFARALYVYGTDTGAQGTYFLAESEGKAIASFGLQELTPTTEKGGRVWGELEKENSKLKKVLEKENGMIWEVRGICTSPEFQGRGLQRRLVQKAIDTLHPAIVVGDTKTPEAVLTRAKIFDDNGYRTFYGKTEVTPSHFQKRTKDHKAILKALLTMYPQDIADEKRGMTYYPVDCLPPDIPDTSKMPEHIKYAFEDVAHYQRILNHDDGNITIVKSLISIRRDLLPKTRCWSGLKLR